MSTNDKQTAPERTAMQELIDYDKALTSNGRENVSADLILEYLRKKMVELRDTKEKEQLIDAIKLGQKNVTGMDAWNMPYLRCTPEDLYHEKYGSEDASK